MNYKAAPLPDLTHLYYRPRGGESFFHYCSAAAFWGIVTSQTLWLSSVWALNDGEELWWARKATGLVLGNHATKFPAEFREFILSSLASPDPHVLPLVTSFSRNGDLLSQWRAYAEDGTGFAIKFNPNVLRKMPVHMTSISYRPEQQHQLILNTLQVFYKYWKMRTEAARSAVWEILPYLSFDLIALKHPSFFEEQEVRLVHLLIKNEDSWVDVGGHDENERPIKGVKVMTRNKYGEEVPYIALPFPNRSVVSGVILGPKNPLSNDEVQHKMCKLGFQGASVRRSFSPYR
jgi:hypothetical protein